MSRTRALALLGAVAAAACGAVLPRSAPSEFYVLSTLSAPPPGATTPPPAPSVLVGRVALPPYLDRPELVTRLASNQLHVEDMELWAEPLRDGVPRTIERDLSVLLGDGRVARLSPTALASADRVVSIELRRFEKTARRTVELEATWTITDGAGRNVRLRMDTRVSVAMTAASTQAAVSAMSDALATLSRDIVGGLRNTGGVARSSAGEIQERAQR
jgi:uncharacterized lipoprotein YmbA